MKSRSGLFMLFIFIAMLVLAACGGAAPAATEAPPDFVEAAATEAPAYAEAPMVDQSVAKEGEVSHKRPQGWLRFLRLPPMRFPIQRGT